MIEFYKNTITNKKLQKYDEFSKGSWIYVVKPSKHELNELSEKYQLDIELLEECLDENELPRVDYDIHDNSYIYSKYVDIFDLKLYTMLTIIGKNFIMTILPKEKKILKEIFDEKVNIITTQKIRTLLYILEILINNTQDSVLKIVKEVNKIKNARKEIRQKDLENLLRYEEFLSELISNYNYSNNLFFKIPKKFKLFQEDSMLLKDLIVETEEGMHICKNSLKSITNIRSFYSSILSNRLNKNITFLTIATILLNIPAVIGSLYGMNVNIPLSQNPFIFYYILLLMFVIIVSFLYLFKKMGVFKY
ncbi:MAG: magnesium transporter CorA family protein [Candidatus Woesearchaeota archaeon]|jgi:magnesium transporter|nr:magnesium transporter CorA family protein [Candidatus Woesearchaeota archaeon]